MKIAAVLAAHRRLLALCAASLLLHVVAIEWIAVRTDIRARSPLGAPPAPIALRLAARAAGTATPAAAAAPLPRQTPAPQQGQAALPPPPLPAAVSGQPSPRIAAAPAQTPAAPDADGGDDAPVQMPGRYRVRMPPSARLGYALYRALPGQPAAPAGLARIEWQADGQRYTLRTDGVPGQLSSEGASGDAGIAPEEASEQRSDGTLATTRFDEAAGRIVFGGAAQSYPLHEGSQDRASLLMQLAGIGLAEPDQIQGVIEVFVGGAQDAGVVKFQVMGQEDVATPLGTLASWRLVQLARPGETRLELWLAPQHGWLPVQLRATAPDGTVSTQVVTQIETEFVGG
jgi:hypothetical protein